jgi:hypothetical protein
VKANGRQSGQCQHRQHAQLNAATRLRDGEQPARQRAIRMGELVLLEVLELVHEPQGEEEQHQTEHAAAEGGPAHRAVRDGPAGQYVARGQQQVDGDGIALANVGEPGRVQ